MGTSSSTSGPRSSPAATSPRRSPAALKRYVDVQEGLREGFDDVVVRVGIGSGRKVRFTGVLVGEWVDSRAKRADHYRVWRGRTGKYVVHVERSAEYWAVDAEGKPAGWRGWMGVGDVRYGGAPEGIDPRGRRRRLDELRDKVPPELFEMVDALRAPADRGGARHLTRAARRTSAGGAR